MSSTDDPHPAAPRKRSRKRWGCGAVLLVGLALLTAAAGVAYWLWSSEPAYVAANRAFLHSQSPAELERMATALENRISRQLTELPPAPASRPATRAAERGAERDGSAAPTDASRTHSTGTTDTTEAAAQPGNDDDAPTSFEELQQLARQTGTREIEMTVGEVNAWLATRSEKWLANEGLSTPEQINDPMIAIEGERVVIGFHFSEGDFSQWVSLSLDVDTSSTGQATVRLAGVRGGRLPLPAKRALERGEEELADRVGRQTWQEARAALDGQTVDARFRLDQRLATLVDFEAKGNKVLLTVRVEPMTQENAEAAEGAPSLR